MCSREGARKEKNEEGLLTCIEGKLRKTTLRK